MIRRPDKELELKSITFTCDYFAPDGILLIMFQLINIYENYEIYIFFSIYDH